jgi:hypothetical protein
MGYRSVVAFCIQTKEPEKFVALLKLKADPVIQEILEHMYLDDMNLLHFYADHWKWYSESETALSEIMNMAGDYDDRFAARYARYGEDNDDVHEEAFGDMGWDLDYPYVTRDIETGFNPDTAKKVIQEEVNYG